MSKIWWSLSNAFNSHNNHFLYQCGQKCVSLNNNNNNVFDKFLQIIYTLDFANHAECFFHDSRHPVVSISVQYKIQLAENYLVYR